MGAFTDGCGRHVIVVTDDPRHAIQNELSLKDTLLVIKPGQPLFALLLVPRDETGALWVDGCRIPAFDPFGGGRKMSSGGLYLVQRSGEGTPYEHDGWHPGSELGRWPTNVCLIHAPGCTRTKTTRQRQGRGADHETWTGDLWTCAPQCPVQLIDRQGGLRADQDRLTDGVSRFYPQFSGLTECLGWLGRLINGSTPP